MMRVAILTSSRADYGIYKPLLKALKDDSSFEYCIIAFGTHVSAYYGKTIDRIIEDGFEVKYTLNSLLLNDDANSISTATALTSLKFADFWKEHSSEFDVVFCLGDRYEMFAAVMAGIPFGIKFAHIHGGETTLGAIDNIYRHSITHASVLHFTSAEEHANKVKSLLGQDDGVYVSGSLSIDNLKEIEILSVEAFKKKWLIDLTKPSILITIHPETVHPERNKLYVKKVDVVLRKLIEQYQLVFTMPNADTSGSVWRNLFQQLTNQFNDKAFAVENFGTQSYFSCITHCKFLLGNTSSGIIEAASFGKYAIDIGDRQKGRIAGDNVLHVSFEGEEILKAVSKVEMAGTYKGVNPYFKGGAVAIIVETLKKLSANLIQ